MKRLILAFLLPFFVGLGGCQDDVLSEFPELGPHLEADVNEIPIVSYNIHGGKGPNGEGDFSSNLNAFEELLQGELLICMQEVEPDKWESLKQIFPEYTERFYLGQCSTKFGTSKKGGNAILSKMTILEYDHALIQIDPGGDKWERKAQYVKFYIGGDRGNMHVFHYHNTYNWHNDDSASEKAGFQKFVNWVKTKPTYEGEAIVLMGDFNLSRSQCEAILNLSDFPNRHSNWVDHIFTNVIFLQTGDYDTAGRSLSDHNAVWTVLCNSDC